MSCALRTPFSSTVPLSPKYKPPVSSLIIIISKPFPIISFLRGQACFNSLYKYAGRILANNSSSLRIFKSPASGLLSGGSLYHGEVLVLPPMEPISTASALLHTFTASSVSGTPCTSMEAPPISTSVYVKLWPYFSATASKTFLASLTISGPMPSPEITATL